LLPRVRMRRVLLRLVDRLLDRGRELALGEGGERERLRRMTRDEVGRRGDREVERGDRVADIALQLANRGLVVGERLRRTPAHRDAARVVMLHGRYLL